MMLIQEQNAIRKEMHKDYYKDHDMHALPDDIRTVHIGISHLRNGDEQRK